MSMTISPLAIIFTVLGGLVLAGLLGWIKKSRLIVLVPRLFTHSHLTNRGQLAEITVFNRGFKTEEAIELILNPNFKYEIVGSNTQDTSINKSKLCISRIGAGDEISTVLLVEGGTFTKADIVSCLSKETKGTVIAKIEDIIPTGPQRIGLVGFFVAVPLILYLFVNYVFERPTDGANQSEGNKDKKVVVQDWNIAKLYASGELYKKFNEGNIQVSFKPFSRKKDIITVTIVVENKIEIPLFYTISMTTIASEEKIPSYERYLSDVHVLPASKAERKINVIVPSGAVTAAEKTVYIELFLESTEGDSLKMTRSLLVDI